MKKLVIAVAVAAVAGGAYYANYTATQEVKKVVDQQIAALSAQSGVEVMYDDISASVFSNSVQLSGIKVQSVEGDEQVASIDTIEVTGYEEDAILHTLGL